MALPQVLGGTGEEITRHDEELTGKRLRLVVLPEEMPEGTRPNVKATARTHCACCGRHAGEPCMAMTPPGSGAGAAVADASVAVALAAKEAATEPRAAAAFAHYTALGYDFFAPGVLASEGLYVLCGKLQDGSLTPAAHARAVQDFHALMSLILAPPGGEGVLNLRAEAIRGQYTCRRSADGLYVAPAELLTAVRPTVLLTFDQDMPKQAVRAAPAVTVHLL